MASLSRSVTPPRQKPHKSVVEAVQRGGATDGTNVPFRRKTCPVMISPGGSGNGFDALCATAASVRPISANTAMLPSVKATCLSHQRIRASPVRAASAMKKHRRDDVKAIEAHQLCLNLIDGRGYF